MCYNRSKKQKPRDLHVKITWKGESDMNKADKETLSAIIQTQIGVSKKLKGYQYLEDAVEIALQNPQMPVMQIYQLLGNQHGRSAVSIERTLRYAIETAYDKTQLNGSFPNSGGKPSNSEVIWTIAEKSNGYAIMPVGRLNFP